MQVKQCKIWLSKILQTYSVKLREVLMRVTYGVSNVLVDVTKELNVGEAPMFWHGQGINTKQEMSLLGDCMSIDDYDYWLANGYTVWKFGNFPATHILREINFWASGVSKSAILIVLTPLKVKFGFSEFFAFGQSWNLQNSNFRGTRSG